MNSIFDERRYLIPFRSILLPQIFTDTLVIGTGAAGLRAAVEAARGGDVIVTSKESIDLSNTSWAQGGIAGVLHAEDSVDAHTRDTLDAGAGLCDEPMVRSIVEQSADAIECLLEWGLRADTGEDGHIALAREGGHSARRILHCDGDATGRELARCLIERVRGTAGIRVFDRCFVLDLITANDLPGAPCLGAITHHPRHGLQMIWARSTVLATGGAGVLWRESTNPPVATGDGIAMAYRAGAGVADLAFMQFHPTALYVAGASRTLISEAVRGEGAVLRDAVGNRIMEGVHPLEDLAPRDIVSRRIHQALSRSSEACVYLDARAVRDFPRRFPGIAESLYRFDLDPARDPIPVNPAAHYFVGGVRTDDSGRTDVPNLYVVGEAACTGLHGANRLASNSLLEALVVGEKAGRACAQPFGAQSSAGPVHIISDIPISEHAAIDLQDVRSSLRSAMWRNAGIERNGRRLSDVEEMAGFWARYTLDKIFDEPQGWETQNLLLVGALVARSASWREETRGCHARDDYPDSDEAFRVHDLWRRGVSQALREPVARTTLEMTGG